MLDPCAKTTIPVATDFTVAHDTLAEMAKEHRYEINTKWTGNLGSGTGDYRSYSRNHEVGGPGKQALIPGSSDKEFLGDSARYNPEEMLVASLSTCHMLWILHLCADAGIAITEYTDSASGTMLQHEDGSGEFIGVTLNPRMKIADSARIGEATALHAKAHRLCFIARSVKFSVTHDPVVVA